MADRLAPGGIGKVDDLSRSKNLEVEDEMVRTPAHSGEPPRPATEPAIDGEPARKKP